MQINYSNNNKIKILQIKNNNNKIKINNNSKIKIRKLILMRNQII